MSHASRKDFREKTPVSSGQPPSHPEKNNKITKPAKSDGSVDKQADQKPGLFDRVKNQLAGIITGSADNDPAAITTYAVAGASSGYSLLWLMILSTPMLIAIQSISARIGDATHKGLGQVLRENFPRPLSYLVVVALLITTVLMIGADLIGIGTAFQLMLGINFLLWIVPVATLIWLLVLFTKFETFTRYLSVITLVFLTYIVSAVLAKPDWGQVVHSIALPPIQFNFTYLSTAVAILGATFTPPLFFWQAKEEIEEQGTDKREKARKQDIIMAPGFVFGQLVTVFIMIATAATLFKNHQQIKTAADAARALQPLAGPAAKDIFAIGLIGAGLIAIPVLASSAGYMVAELFGWKQSLSEQVDRAKGFYIVITISLFVGVELAISGIDPIQAMFYSQMLAGVVGPFVMLMILIVANRKSVMGNFTSRWFDNLFGGLAVLTMSISTIMLFVQMLTGKK